MLRDYLPVLLQIIVAVGFAASALIVSVLLGKAGRRSRIKDSPYECGMVPIGEAQPRFSVRFYLIAMLFILFDLEMEKNEENGDQIKPYAESRLRFTDRYHPAFIGRIFDPAAAAGLTQKHAHDQGRGGETDRDNDLQQDWKIISQHPALSVARELSDRCYGNMTVLRRNRAG